MQIAQTIVSALSALIDECSLSWQHEGVLLCFLSLMVMLQHLPSRSKIQLSLECVRVGHVKCLFMYLLLYRQNAGREPQGEGCTY